MCWGNLSSWHFVPGRLVHMAPSRLEVGAGEPAPQSREHVAATESPSLVPGIHARELASAWKGPGALLRLPQASPSPSEQPTPLIILKSSLAGQPSHSCLWSQHWGGGDRLSLSPRPGRSTERGPGQLGPHRETVSGNLQQQQTSCLLASTCNPSTQEVAAGRLGVQVQSGLRETLSLKRNYNLTGCHVLFGRRCVLVSV